MSTTIGLSPLVPLWLLAALGLAALALFALQPRRRGALLRLAAMALLLLALLDPHIRREEREIIPGVVAVVVDRSGSQTINGRADETARLRAALEEKLKALKHIEVRWIEAGDTVSEESDGTELFRALDDGTGDVAPDRLAGVIFITDGQVHDIPAIGNTLPFKAPLHALITGRELESDRRLIVESAPRFALVGQSVSFMLRVEDIGATMEGPVALTVRRDGDIITRMELVPGRSTRVDVDISHAGDNVVEMEVDALPGELTALNNLAAITVKGVRDGLKVLLVSGAPHAGERTWRNLLKSDTSVNLVHFTILRQPDRVDATPLRELSLIAFPIKELFQDKIGEFDLIIFDRYERRGILPPTYFDNIARYVRDGGALLIAAGPEDAGVDSLFQTSLAPLLPADPTGAVTETPFLPRLSEDGKRHPVTRDLHGALAEPPQWSRWFRLVNADRRSGRSIMEGPQKKPLLVLDRVQEGRVAILLSDHAWLWSRNFEGGGPHAELLRRLSHWLMKEPDLEEEALRASKAGDEIIIERQTMADTVGSVSLERPSGEKSDIPLSPHQPGLWRARIPAGEVGIYRFSDGTRTVLVHMGPTNPREFTDARSTTEALLPLARQTGGSVRRAATDQGVEIPRLVLVSDG